MNATKALAGTATVVVGLMLLKNGHLTKLFKDAATGATDFAEGVKGITGLA